VSSVFEEPRSLSYSRCTPPMVADSAFLLGRSRCNLVAMGGLRPVSSMMEGPLIAFLSCKNPTKGVSTKHSPNGNKELVVHTTKWPSTVGSTHHKTAINSWKNTPQNGHKQLVVHTTKWPATVSGMHYKMATQQLVACITKWPPNS